MHIYLLAGLIESFHAEKAQLKRLIASHKRDRVRNTRHICHLEVKESLMEELRSLGYHTHCLLGMVPKLGNGKYSQGIYFFNANFYIRNRRYIPKQTGQLDGIQSNMKCNSQMVGYYHAIHCCSDDIRSVIRAIATTRNQFLSDYTRYRHRLLSMRN